MKEDKSLRVRINLRLAQTEKAEDILRVNRYDAAGELISSPSAAYISGIVLHNVTPVINESLRARIAAGQIRKNSCAWLEGDLVAWAGRYRAKADGKLKRTLEEYRVRDVFNREAARAALAEGTKVGFNPKKFRHFYDMATKNIFLKAASATVCHWAFTVRDAEFRPRTEDDVVKDGVPPSDFEISDLPKGILTTWKRLEALGL